MAQKESVKGSVVNWSINDSCSQWDFVIRVTSTDELDETTSMPLNRHANKVIVVIHRVEISDTMLNLNEISGF